MNNKIQQEGITVKTASRRRMNRAASIAGGILATLLVCGLIAGSWYVGRFQARLEDEHRTVVSTFKDGGRIIANNAKYAKDWWMNTAVQQESKLATKLDSRLAQRNNQKEARLQEHLQNMDFANQSQTEQLKQVQGELADSRKEMAALREDNAILKTQHEQTLRHLQEVESANHKERIDFNLQKFHAQTVAPGIAVAVQFTDPAAQRFNAYVKLQNDQRTVWIRNQEAQVPVLIYPKAGGDPIHLVVNQVNNRDVVGYLLVPGKTESGK